MNRAKSAHRSTEGLTLVELLTVVLIMGFVSAAAFGILVASMNSGRQLEQKCDSVDSIRNALEKFGREVRMGRNVGDVYGNIQPGTGDVFGSPDFPGTNDPILGNGAAAPTIQGVQGWPTWADGSAPTVFSMQPPPGNGVTDGNNCFVCQIPIFDGNGIPAGIPVGYKSAGSTATPSPTATNTAVETHVYRIVADPDVVNNPGEFLMQVCVIPGYGQAGTAGLLPTTLVKHIIGPINPNNAGAIVPIRAFQYVDRANPTAAPADGIPAGGVPPAANYSGAIVNLEVSPHNTTSQQSERKPFALRSEVYLRNNSLANSVGLPPGSNGY